MGKGHTFFFVCSILCAEYTDGMEGVCLEKAGLGATDLGPAAQPTSILIQVTVGRPRFATFCKDS